MNSKQIRQTFLDFFKEKQHEIVASAPMVVKDDPTLMFTNAGMNQFKDLFLGNSKVKFPRITNSQKCLRVSGKHNDLEEVGVDTYHHTMFEMLGNWSFGDYFKEEAIAWAWELLTERYGIDKDKLYITVFEGDKSDNLSVDQEAIDLWKNHISEDRIILCDKKDNFWEMGEVGPCGPCSEIHIDLRSQEDRKATDGRTLVNEDHPQVIEIWNLVFMQFNRMASGELVPLPNTHVDTGMGFERLAVALQGKTSNYDTDVFMPLINKIESLSGEKYGKSETTDIAIRVIADHIRTISFSIADGQLPSNTGAGYVIRRILRRAVRYGYQTLELKEPFMYQLVDVLVDQMGEAFPELSAQKDLIQKVTKEEETAFHRTLDVGLVKMNLLSKEASSNGKSHIDGKSAFEMYDTYGFPLDLISLIAQENNLQVDLEGFNRELEEQRNRSRSATSMETGDWIILEEDDKEEFLGYDYLECDVRITKYRNVVIKKEEFVQLVFTKTPFYPEGGGQVGDKGVISNEVETIEIIDTKKENNLIIHFAKSLPNNPKATFKAKVDELLRLESAKNHTATHLLHEALRDVLGTHVEQKGSLVNADQLRFDFSHFSKVTEEELLQVEAQVNSRIRAGIELTEKRNTPIEEAKSMGAMALFGEKYGDTVRVIKFDSSVELCGGTHVNRTSEIGQLKIVSEGSVASGVRRIEAITSTKADAYTKEKLDELDQVKALLKNPKDVLKSIQNLLSENSNLSKELEQFNKEKAGNLSGDLIKDIKEINGIKFIAKKVDIDNASVKDLAFKLKQDVDNLFLVLATENEGKVTLSIALSNDLVSDKKMHAGNIIREVAKEINGGGGGQPFFATAGGKNPAGIEKAFEKALTYLN